MLSDDDRARVAAAITDAELRTSGEIVVVVSDEVDRYPATGLTIAALLAFAVPLAMTLVGLSPGTIAGFSDWNTGEPATDLRRAVEAYAAVQVAVFVVVAGVLLRTRLGARLTPRGIKRDRVHAEALRQFRARGIGATRARTGVLVYVATADHVAEVVADAGIYAKVPPEHWGTTVEALIAGVKAGTLALGLVDAIRLAGGVLAEHFPPDTANSDELPNRLIEI